MLVRLAALTSDTASLVDGAFSYLLVDVSTPFAMFYGDYNEILAHLQHLAANAQGIAAAEAADLRFKAFAFNTSLKHLQADDYILAVHNSSSSSDPEANQPDAVLLAAHVCSLHG